MKVATLQTAIAITEIVIGLIFMALGSYSLLLNLKCPPESHDCVGWGIIGAAMFLFPGGFIVAAGTLSYRTKRFPFWIVQAALIGVLILYYIAGFAFP